MLFVKWNGTHINQFEKEKTKRNRKTQNRINFYIHTLFALYSVLNLTKSKENKKQKIRYVNANNTKFKKNEREIQFHAEDLFKCIIH